MVQVSVSVFLSKTNNKIKTYYFHTNSVCYENTMEKYNLKIVKFIDNYVHYEIVFSKLKK